MNLAPHCAHRQRHGSLASGLYLGSLAITQSTEIALDDRFLARKILPLTLSGRTRRSDLLFQDFDDLAIAQAHLHPGSDQFAILDQVTEGVITLIDHRGCR